MKKFALILGTMLLAVSMVAVAQSVDDSFSSMRNWEVGDGDWVVRGGRLVQQDADSKLARIDRRVTQRGEYELEFSIRYVDGGYKSRADLEDGIFHAGFGIHMGVENPALGKPSWGAGESYLLWLNLDTRPETRRNHPEHYGVRAQVYKSTSNTEMELMREPALRRDPDFRPLVEDDYMSLDLVKALENFGVRVTMEGAQKYLDVDVPVNIRVNTRTGRIGVLDPTAPVRFYFSVDPSVLRGNYVSVRTNDLAASFDYFTVE